MSSTSFDVDQVTHSLFLSAVSLPLSLSLMLMFVPHVYPRKRKNFWFTSKVFAKEIEGCLSLSLLLTPELTLESLSCSTEAIMILVQESRSLGRHKYRIPSSLISLSLAKCVDGRGKDKLSLRPFSSASFSSLL